MIRKKFATASFGALNSTTRYALGSYNIPSAVRFFSTDQHRQFDHASVRNQLDSDSRMLDLTRFRISTDDMRSLEKMLENGVGKPCAVKWGQLEEGTSSYQRTVESIVKKNSDEYRDRPSHHEYAVLCAADPKKLTDSAGLPSSWKVYEEFADGDYSATAYINKIHKQIVIVHCGPTVGDVVRFTRALKKIADYSERYIDKALPFTSEVCQKAQKKGHTVSFTGHGIGAWIAQALIYECAADKQLPDVSAVVFDSPGIEKYFEMRQKSSVPSRAIEPRNLDITTYVSPPNLINTFDKHAGSVFKIDLELPEKCTLFRYFRLTFNSDAIDKFVHALDHNHKTRIETVEEWPVSNLSQALTISPLEFTDNLSVLDVASAVSGNVMPMAFNFTFGHARKVASFAADVFSSLFENKADTRNRFPAFPGMKENNFLVFKTPLNMQGVDFNQASHRYILSRARGYGVTQFCPNELNIIHFNRGVRKFLSELNLPHRVLLGWLFEYYEISPEEQELLFSFRLESESHPPLVRLFGVNKSAVEFRRKLTLFMEMYPNILDPNSYEKTFATYLYQRAMETFKIIGDKSKVSEAPKTTEELNVLKVSKVPTDQNSEHINALTITRVDQSQIINSIQSESKSDVLDFFENLIRLIRFHMSNPNIKKEARDVLIRNLSEFENAVHVIRIIKTERRTDKNNHDQATEEMLNAEIISNMTDTRKVKESEANLIKRVLDFIRTRSSEKIYTYFVAWLVLALLGLFIKYYIDQSDTNERKKFMRKNVKEKIDEGEKIHKMLEELSSSILFDVFNNKGAVDKSFQSQFRNRFSDCSLARERVRNNIFNNLQDYERGSLLRIQDILAIDMKSCKLIFKLMQSNPDVLEVKSLIEEIRGKERYWFLTDNKTYMLAMIMAGEFLINKKEYEFAKVCYDSVLSSNKHFGEIITGIENKQIEARISSIGEPESFPVRIFGSLFGKK